jgi:cell division transport system ATP-binding protein
VIARAILNHPALLLADEPTGNLDNETGKYIMQLLHRICQEEKTAVLMITHNEQWLTMFPGREFNCKNKKITENIKTDSAVENTADDNTENNTDNNETI